MLRYQLSLSLDDFKDQLVEFIVELWDAKEVETWRETLVTLSGGAGSQEVDDIIAIAADAEAAHSELQNMSDDDSDYEEIESGMEDDLEKALDLLDRYWTKYSA